jgi:arylsulfatase A-like enzyme
MTNLLFIFTDEQRADTLGAYGNGKIQTPNLDRLAADSVLFERAYITQPVCTPSRSSILTGLYPHTNGCTANNIPLGVDTPCLPEMLPDGKYATGYHGKWHLGDEIFAQHGFDDWRSIEDMYRKYYRENRDRDARSSYHHFLVEEGFEPDDDNVFGRGTCAALPEEYGKPAYLAREASRFIRAHREEPFVLFVNFLEPHMPFTGPRDDQYGPDGVTLPANFGNPPTEEQHPKARLMYHSYYEKGHGGMPLKTEANWRRLIANYWGLCSLVDTHAGRIIDTLRECGLYEDTIIVYTSDHGDMMGSHRLLAKCLMFEEASTVPMMIKPAGRTEARRVKGPVSQIDLLPTLLDLMGGSIPGHVQGRSLKDLVLGDSEPDRDVFIEWNGRDTGVSLRERVAGQESVSLPGGFDEEKAIAAVADSVRTVVSQDGWKFNFSPMGEHELYNLAQDPWETRNLAGVAAHKPLMRDLAERIRAWQGRTSDGISLPEGP